ncbi:MAG: MFS transporter [Rhodoplanes sp.]|uniref:MFS transporter n=1 Tax=Rhodoplanes sp. TaxID=1968906 RepID=UPI001835F2C1|nr:MFS transporter [Rhodoplanes sp.]NVO15518.1 MFS transporter [Rhodoplanes sp.]
MISATIRRRRTLIFVVIALTYVISYFHRAAPVVVGPVIAGELGLSPSQLGLMSSMYFWAYALAVFPSGLLSDGWGARKTIAAFVLLAAVAGFAFAFAESTATLAVSRFVIGLGVSVVYVAALRIFADWYSPNELATYSGLLLAFGNIGALLSTAPLAAAIAMVGWRDVFTIVAVLTAVAAVVSYAVVVDTPAELERRRTLSPDPAPIRTGPSGLAMLRDTIVAVLSERRIYLLGVLVFSFYGTFMGVGSLWAGPYLHAVYGLSKQEASHILMLFPLGMTIGCPLAGYLSDKVFGSRRPVLLYGGILHLLVYIPLVFFTGDMNEWLLGAVFLWYGLSGGAFVVCFAAAKELYDSRYAGAAVGAVTMFLQCGGAFYQYVIGVVVGQPALVGAGSDVVALYSRAFAAPMVGLALGLVLFSRFRESGSLATARAAPSGRPDAAAVPSLVPVSGSRSDR